MIPLIDQFPNEKLTAEEEAALARKAQQGSQDAANKLVLANMREALKYTQRVCNDSIREDERCSHCYRKLMMCVPLFQPKRGRFFAFAKAGLRGEMKTYWTNLTTVRNATQMISADRLSGWRGILPGSRENFHARRVRPPTEWTHARPHGPVSKEDDPVDSFREEITGEVEAPDLDLICARDRWHEIKKLVWNKLTARQRMVLCLTYQAGLNFPETGKLLGVTRSLIHAIHRETLKIIRDELARDGRLLKE